MPKYKSKFSWYISKAFVSMVEADYPGKVWGTWSGTRHIGFDYKDGLDYLTVRVHQIDGYPQIKVKDLTERNPVYPTIDLLRRKVERLSEVLEIAESLYEEIKPKPAETASGIPPSRLPYPQEVS